VQATDEIVSQYLLWLCLVEKQCSRIGYTTDSFGNYSFSEDFVLGRNEHEAVHNAMEFWNTTMRSRLATA
jgi:hypothetical protein